MLTRYNSPSEGERPSPIQVIPAIDVLDGVVVRLRRGDFQQKFLEGGDPCLLLRRYADAGAQLVHVVDLAAARDGRLDADLVSRLTGATSDTGVQIAGGIRSPDDARRAVELGATRVVVGTAALSADGCVEELVDVLRERLVVAIDVRDGEVVSHGWLRGTGRTAEAVVRSCAVAGVERLLCTAIERDGMPGGPDLALLEQVVGASPLPVIASGGVGSTADIESLASIGVEACVVGRALLDGSLPLSAVS